MTILTIVLILLVILIVLGLVVFKEKSITCKIDKNTSKNDYKNEAVYTIYSKNDKVKRVKISESLTSKNTTIVKYLNSKIKASYEEENKKYNGYDIKINEDKNKVEYEITVDYSKMNLKEFVNSNINLKKYYKNNSISEKGIKEYYESLGAECK